MGGLLRRLIVLVLLGHRRRFRGGAGAKLITRWVDAPLWLLALGLMILMTATNLFSVKSYGEFEYWFAGIKVFAIITFLVLGGLFVIGLWPGRDADFSNLTAHGGFLPNGPAAIFSASRSSSSDRSSCSR